MFISILSCILSGLTSDSFQVYLEVIYLLADLFSCLMNRICESLSFEHFFNNGHNAYTLIGNLIYFEPFYIAIIWISAHLISFHF